MTLDQMPLYPDEAAIAAAVLGNKRAKDWPRIAAHLEAKHELPPVDAEMGGRFWPAVKQYFYSRHGMQFDGTLHATSSSRIRVVPFNPNGRGDGDPPPDRRGPPAPKP
jgi:hypothetical protein